MFIRKCDFFAALFSVTLAVTVAPGCSDGDVNNGRLDTGVDQGAPDGGESMDGAAMDAVDDVASRDTADDADQDMGARSPREIELREWRLDGPGPGIEGRTVVQFETASLNAIDSAQTDENGLVEFNARGPLHVVFEAPHGRNFYILPNVPADTRVIAAHPDFPGPDQTETLQVTFDEMGTSFSEGTLTAGGEGTLQTFTTGAGSEATIELQRRNFHAGGTVSIVAGFGGAASPVVRAALRQDPSSGVVLDRSLNPVSIRVDGGQAEVSVEEVTFFGLAGGARLPLAAPSSPSTAYLPIDNGQLDQDVFDDFELEISGTVKSGQQESLWQLRRRMSPGDVSQLLDSNAETVAIDPDLSAPFMVETADTDASLIEVVSEVRGQSLGHPSAELVTRPAGSDPSSTMPAIYLTGGEDEVAVRAETDGSEWVDVLEPPATGSAVTEQRVKVTNVQGTADIDEPRVDVTWVASSKDCDEDKDGDVYIGQVSDWLFGLRTDGAGNCSPVRSPAQVGESAKLTANAMMGTTVTPPLPDGNWASPTNADVPVPAEGREHHANIIVHQFPDDAAWSVVVDSAFGLTDGGLVRLVPDDDPDDLQPWSVRRTLAAEGRAGFTASWESK